MKPTVVMHSTLSPDALGEAIRTGIDPEHRTLFSLSGYAGDKPILGEVSANTFRLQRRRISRNDFAGHFYGTIGPEQGGARVEGCFAAPRWARYFMRFWIAFALICGVPVFVSSLRELLRGDPKGDLWVGLVVPPFLVFVGTVLPMLTQRFGRGDRRRMIEFIQQVGAAKIDDIESAVRSTNWPF